MAYEHNLAKQEAERLNAEINEQKEKLESTCAMSESNKKALLDLEGLIDKETDTAEKLDELNKELSQKEQELKAVEDEHEECEKQCEQVFGKTEALRTTITLKKELVEEKNRENKELEDNKIKEEQNIAAQEKKFEELSKLYSEALKEKAAKEAALRMIEGDISKVSNEIVKVEKLATVN